MRYVSTRGTAPTLDFDDALLAGLARDVCVRWTAEDAVAAGFRTRVLWDLTRSVDPSGDPELRAALEEHGVEVVDAFPERG